MSDTEREALYRRAGPFLRTIVAAPGDPMPRLIFADWLGEQGWHREEAGQRWAAKHGKYPLPVGQQITWGGWYSGEDRDLLEGSAYPASCHLPLILTTDEVVGPNGRTNEGLVACELAFLRRCGEMEWGADGEPVGEVARV